MTGRTCIRTGELARHINGNRLWHRLMSLAEVGASSGGGIDRQALSDAEIAARGRVVRWGREIGLEAATDPVANLFLSYKGTEPDLAPVFVGSHIDTQPTGGKFDGALGVLAALESIEAMIARGVRPRRTIEIVAWMNEEGSRFAPGMMGSAVFSGARQLQDILGIRDKAGITVEAELRKVLSAEPRLSERPFGAKPAAFLEAHIEQGPVLELEKKDHRGRYRNARQTHLSSAGRWGRESCRDIAAGCSARCACLCRRHRARAAGRDMGSRGRRTLHHWHVHRQSQCTFCCTRACCLLH